MDKRMMGPVEVSRLCFGSLTMTPSQGNLSHKEGANLIINAFERGVNFLDTAEYYENYEYIRLALESIPRDEFIIATKTYAYDVNGAKKAFEDACKALNTDYIDIFMLHEQEDINTLNGHYEALEELFRLKELGYIRAVGISTHKVAAVRASLKFKEIEIIHPMINYKGLGILDGTKDEMLDAIKAAHKQGIGIYGMKILGGGHLIDTAEYAINWALDQEFLDSIALGMQSEEELISNICLFEGKEVPESVKDKLKTKNRTIEIEDYCTGCGKCVKRCQANAIDIIGGTAHINEKCILCSYCAAICPEFCIKVY
ncbi:MAG: aldo/keto reductase [Tissierellia bacterium]|nr:aldo/keto reductase [Tissierellia bacterium]